MKNISYSAPGKVILSGEHAVVYGKPALVCSINKRLTVTISQAKKDQKKRQEEFVIIENAVSTFLSKQSFLYTPKPYSFSISSDIPIGRGLGSSAAFSVAGSAALLEWYTEKRWSEEQINNCAYLAEKQFHARPSGVDNTTSVYGGLVYYRKEFEFLKTISSLSMQIPQSFCSQLYLIDSGKPTESTAEMVKGVGTLYNNKLSFMEKVLGEIEKLTKRIVVSIAKEDSSFFKKSIYENQMLLQKIGVVSSQTSQFLQTMHQWGVGKITGAGGKIGGSGYILFFAEHKDKLLSYLNTKHIDYFPFSPSWQGVQKQNG